MPFKIVSALEIFESITAAAGLLTGSPANEWDELWQQKMSAIFMYSIWGEKEDRKIISEASVIQ